MKGKQQDFRTEKYIRYGIRKYSFGAASVAIAAGLMFLGNGAVSATEQNPVSDSKENIQKVGNTSPELGESNIQLTEKTAETPKKEVVKVNKSLLETSISNLETALSNAKYADASVVANAREALAAAKSILANETAKQEEVNIQKDILSSLKTVVTESNKLGLEKEQADKDKVAKEEAERKATPTEKALSEAKSALDKVSSEADVTNTLAVTELRKKEVAEENRVAIEAAVAKNQAVINESKILLADKSVTKEQVDAQLARLNESILAVYSELKKAGIGRDGKYEVVLADLAEKVDEAPLTEAEQADHWKKYAEKNTERLRHQIKWFDITSKTAVVENLGDGGKLKVGTKFKQELTPGYVVEMEVTALKPFNSTDVYKERGGAGYDANAKNVYSDGTEAEVKVVRQGGYSVAKTNGIDTGGTTVIQSVRNGANVGVEFKVKATLNGKEVPANVVFATGEEAGSSEIEIYKTDGDGFELVTELSNTNYRVPTARSYTAESYDNRYNLSPVGNGQGRQLGQSYSIEGKGKTAFEPFIADKAKGFRSTEITEETVSTVTDSDGKVYSDGLGTQVFGPAVTHRDSGMSTPVVLTRNAKNLGVYILSSGQQGAMFGFMVLDEGDAPASYGKVAHAIAKGNGVKQPYLGSNAPDVDIRTEKITKENAFKYDDENGEGRDEGARQLMGDKVIATEKGDNYKLKKVNDGIYEMTVDAHLDGGDPAWVNGWIDFNNNGKFDENEAAGAVKVTSDGEVTLRWSTPVQNLDVTATKLATRLRIANDRADVKEATGIAYSGEVEDFEIQQTIPPRGSKETTIDIQGATQRANIKFTAYGHKAYDLDTDSKIDEEVKPQIVKPDGSIVTDAELVDGYYVVPGQGKYKITANGKDVDVEFVPEDSFVGDADGITIRRTDINGETTGWGKNGKTIINGSGENEDKLVPISEQVAPEGSVEKGTMDGRYIPRVMKREIIGKTEVSNDVQGSKQHKTPEFKDTAGNKITPSTEFPVKLVDPTTNQPTDTTTIDAKKDGKKIGEYTITPSTGEIVFTPNKDFTGTPDPVTVSFDGKVGVDKDGHPVTSTGTSQYQPTVKPVTPTAENGETTKPQGETQEKEITFTAGKATVTYLDKNDETVEVEKSVPMNPTAYTLLAEDGMTPATEVPARKPDGTEIGKFTLKVVDGKPIAVFTPTDKTYVGDVLPVKIQGEDENGTKATATYTPHITPVAPTAQPGESIAVQGATQKGAPIFTPGSENAPMKPETIKLLNDAGEEAEELPAKNKKGKVVGTYTLDKTTGEVIFTPTDKTFVGKVLPARVQMADSNGTKVDSTYTPKIVPVEPKGTAAESSKAQGLVQQGTVSFAPGKATVGDKEETIALKENSARLVGLDGHVLAPDAKLDVFAEDGKKIGEYTIDSTTNTVTYTPTDKTYTGEVPPAIVRAEDVNGSTAETTYTPNIIPVVPTGTPAKTSGPQGVAQKGTVEFAPGTVEGETPAAINKSTMTLLNSEGTVVETLTVTKDGKEVGVYELVKDENGTPTGEVKFTPTDKTFVGPVEPVTIQVKDENGTVAKTTYTPEFTEVVPTSKESETKDIQGAVQKSPVVFDVKDEEDKSTVNFDRGDERVELDKSTLTLVNVAGEKVNEVVIPNEGKYVLKDGVIEFTPEKQFVGKATSVTVQVEDVNGKVATTKYTPEVVGVQPTATPVESTDIQGKTQTAKPTFTAGDEKVPMDDEVPATFEDGSTVKEIKGVGKYEVAKDGTVTFTPEKSFTGEAPAVTVKRVDKNGTPAIATYTPTVTPVTPTGEVSETEGARGAVQKSSVVFDTPDQDNTTVNFNKGHEKVALDKSTLTLVDKDGKEVKEVTVPGEGTYVLKDGVIEFTPEKDFVGKASGVIVQVKDENGKAVSKTYTPTVRPVTSFKDKEGKEIPNYPSEDGTTPKKDIPEYRFVETKKLPNGDTEHVYEKVNTFFKDKEGKEIPNYPSEPGTVDKKDIPEYRFVETKKLPNGDTEHVYEKVNTFFKDKEGKEIPNYPSEPGTVDKKDIPEYRFVETKKLPNGDTEHVYEKVNTFFKDKEGKEIPNYPSEPGTVDKKEIPEYRFVETKKLPNGDTVHVYEKVNTFFKDKEGKEIPNYPSEPGTVDKKDIPEYRFVETKKLPNGDTEHVYEKVNTFFKDKEGKEIPNYPSEPGTVDKKDIPEYRFVETKKLSNGDVEHVYEKVNTFFKDKEGKEIPNYPSEPGTVDKKDIPEYRFVET
ncbi:CshA/CshB family fibrillar adhesin-related protein, partial [Streptococcus sp.]